MYAAARHRFPPEAFRIGPSARRVAGVLLAALALAGCSRKEPVVAPEPVPPTGVRVEGNRVLWSTDTETRASVRYGFVRGGFDHLAYPDAAGRRDRRFESGEHSVALLDLRPGRKVYFQAVSEAADAAPAYSALDSFAATTSPPSALLSSTMINIGFGDCHVLRMPTTGKTFVIDCGDRDAEISVETYLRDHGVTAVDAMLATHVHSDHLGGVVGSFSSDLDGVIARYPPPVFFDSPSKSSRSLGKAAYQEFLRDLPAGTTRVILNRGDTSQNVPALRLDPEVQIVCLNSGTRPGYFDRPEDYEGTVINNESIVLRFAYGDVDFVIGGDAEQETEASMLGAWPPELLQVEFFKATHHGLSDANSAAWVNALQPRVAFIPNSQRVWDPANTFEPAISSTVSKLQNVRADIYVIDEARPLDRSRGATQYNISFVTDGRSFEVRIEVATQPAPAHKAQAYACVEDAGARAVQAERGAGPDARSSTGPAR